MSEAPSSSRADLKRHAVAAALLVLAGVLAADLLLRRRTPSDAALLSSVDRVPGEVTAPIILGPHTAADTRATTRPAYLQLHFGALDIEGLAIRDALTVLLDVADNPVALVFDTSMETERFGNKPAEASITLHLRDFTFRSGLEAILDAANESDLSLDYHAGFDVLRIGNGVAIQETYPRPTSVSIYDVRDLLRGSITFTRSLASTAPADVNRDIQHRRGLFGGRGHDNIDPATGRPRPRRIDSPEEILSMDLLSAIRAIDPPSWKRCSEPIYFAGRIVIEQTPDNHERIARLLAALRLDPSRLVAEPQ